MAGQTYTCLYYHLIFSTRNRAPQITPDLQNRLYDYIGGIVAKEGGRLLCAGGTCDHVHLLLSMGAKTSLADTLRLVKANSSKWIHETFTDQSRFAWQPGYAAFSVSYSSAERVKAYIADQDAHHHQTSFEEELTAFLKRHHLPYDEKYLFA